MANILYIHGFGSNQDSRSFIGLKEAFPEHSFFSENFDLLNITETFRKIDTICREKDINLIIGKSLGGFYALAYDGPQDKMVINPCIKPWIEIPKLDASVQTSILDEWKRIFKQTEDSIYAHQRSQTFGIFGDEDELFSYKDYFDEHYNPVNVGMQKSFMIPGKHHIDISNLKVAVKKGLDYFGMMERYSCVFSLMPYYQLIKEADKEYELNLSQEEKRSIVDEVEQYHSMLEDYKNNQIFGQ